MTPIANASLKADYAAYCAEQRARHYSPVSYELWLEGTLNACRLDLANAKRALHLPDSYRAALERVDKLLEDAMSRTAPSNPTLYELFELDISLKGSIQMAQQIILIALGGAEEEL